MTEAPAPWDGRPPPQYVEVDLHWLEHPHHGTKFVKWLPMAQKWINPFLGEPRFIDALDMPLAGWRWVAPARVEDAQQRDALLIALKVITEHYSDLMDSGDVLGPRVRHADIPEIAQAVAAIAKAEGRA